MFYDKVVSSGSIALSAGPYDVTQTFDLGWKGLGGARLLRLEFHLLTEAMGQLQNLAATGRVATLGVETQAVFAAANATGQAAAGFAPVALSGDWVTTAPIPAQAARLIYAGGHSHSPQPITFDPAADLKGSFGVVVGLTGTTRALIDGQPVVAEDLHHTATLSFYLRYEVSARMLTPLSEVLHGTRFDDAVSMRAGDDVFYAGTGHDFAEGGLGDDLLVGADGNDTLNGNAGQDTLSGGAGDDLLNGGQGDDVIFAGQGRDRVFGGAGNDRLHGGGSGTELRGGAGDDALYGGPGTDHFYGGAGRDVFHFTHPRQSIPMQGLDYIHDFTQGDDLIDLRGIDADFTTPGQQALVFAGDRAMAHAVWSEQAGGLTHLRVDVNGDAFWDMSIRVQGRIGFSQADFIL